MKKNHSGYQKLYLRISYTVGVIILFLLILFLIRYYCFDLPKIISTTTAGALGACCTLQIAGSVYLFKSRINKGLNSLSGAIGFLVMGLIMNLYSRIFSHTFQEPLWITFLLTLLLVYSVILLRKTRAIFNNLNKVGSRN